jgi:hypothetical protein
MSFNISQFKSVMNRYGGPARTNLFEVLISATNTSGQTIVPGVINQGDLRFFCQTVSVPGINIETAQYRPNGVGFPEFMPVNANPDQLNGVFLLDSNHRVLTFFHRWISSVVNVSGSRGDSVNGLPRQQIEYKDRYAASEVTIRHYSTHDTSRFYECRYLGVYPTQVSSIDLGWATNDAPATITVNFSYNRLIYQGFNDSSFEQSNNFVGTQFSLTRGTTQTQLIQGFNQRNVDALTELPLSLGEPTT